MSEQLTSLDVQIRDARGTRNAKRLRRAGSVPIVLYGHGRENVTLSVSRDVLETAIHQGARVVELKGAVDETAIIRELQWDTWGTHVLHVDFNRIAADESVEVEVSIELRGEAPGVRQGGVLEHLLRSVAIQCPAVSVPEKLQCNVNHLELDASLSVADLEVPESVRVLADADKIVVQIVPPKEELEEEAVAGEKAEPEVIGRKPDDEDE